VRQLIIAPHADDEVLGVGGTVLRAVAEMNEVFVLIVTVGTKPLFDEAYKAGLRSESNRCHSFLGIKQTFYLNYPAVMLETVPRYELNDNILRVIREIGPNEVYIPHWGDIQKDHQLVAEAAMVALRPKNGLHISRVLAYETL
jgi:LmbE family N-acetylglucosaminyl deacetylase